MEPEGSDIQEQNNQTNIQMKKIKHIPIIALLILLGACSSSRMHAELPQTDRRAPREEVSDTEQLKSTALLIDASKQKMLGNWTQAAALYQEAANTDPNNDAAFFELAKIYVRSGDYQGGMEKVQKAAEIDPENPYYQLLIADIHILMEQVEKATKIHKQLAGKEPNNVRHQKKLLDIYMYAERFEDAIGVIEHIESIQGFSEDLSIKKQQIYIHLGMLEKAIEEAEKMIRFFPEEELFYELLGELYMETGQQEKAKHIYLDLLKLIPDSHIPRLLLADYYLKQQDTETAFQYLKESFDSQEMDVESKIRIVFVYMFLADEQDEATHIQKAKELARMIIETHPDDPEAYFVYGDILNRNNQLEEARAQYLKGAQLNPSKLDVWQQILSLDLQLGEYQRMLKHSEMALEYFFEQPVLFLFNGLANMQLKDYEAAASSLEYGLSITIEDEDLKQDFITMLGDVYHYLNMHEESDRYYQQAIDNNPENAIALNNYSYHLALRGERLEEALAMSEKANKINPSNAAFQDTYGWIKYQMGAYEDAEYWIRKALETSEEPSAAILEHYGDVMYKLGDKEKALKYWIKASEAGEGSDLLHKKIKDRTLYE